MADISSLSSAPHTDAEYQAAISVYITDTQHLLDQMQAEQVEIDRLKESGVRVRAEIELLGSQTREILARLEAVV